MAYFLHSLFSNDVKKTNSTSEKNIGHTIMSIQQFFTKSFKINYSCKGNFKNISDFTIYISKTVKSKYDDDN